MHSMMFKAQHRVFHLRLHVVNIVIDPWGYAKQLFQVPFRERTPWIMQLSGFLEFAPGCVGMLYPSARCRNGSGAQFRVVARQ